MTRCIKLFKLLLLLASIAFAGCSNDDDNGGATDIPTVTEVRVVNVDVILPKPIWEEWQNSINWAITNLGIAQSNLQQQVRLNLRYHDENTENLEQLAYQLANPAEGQDTCHAIIGPYYSNHAQSVLNYAVASKLPVVMPTCTSSDLQRMNARNTYAWFLTESDVTQCEIMLSCARSTDASDVALIYSGDTYGKSFVDWFGYYATEFQQHIAGEGQMEYTKGISIEPFLRNITENCEGKTLLLCVAVAAPEDYLDIQNQVYDFVMKSYDEVDEDGNSFNEVVEIIPIFADTSCDEAFISNCNDRFFTLGITPYGSLDHGFPQAYYTTFGRRPINGEAQVYDALTIIALGAYYQMVSPDKCIVDGMEVSYDQNPHGAGLTDYMRAVVSREGISTGWDERSLISAFWYIGQDDYFSLYGATGNLYFDQRTHTKVLNTTYMLWVPKRQDNGQCELVPAIYLSTNGTSSQASTTSIWEQEKRWYDDNFVSEDTPELPDVTDHWAVVISPSTTWANYRHQADALAMYQQLLFSGYDDDHIVLIVEDNLYNDPHNVFPDKIFVNRYGDDEDEDFNVHYNVNVDYHFSQLTPDDIADIMTGRQSDRLPHVIHSTSTSNVFFFWSGHGGSREGPLWGNEDSNEYFGKQRIHDIVEQMNRSKQYRRLLFAIETCYSGHWGEAIQGMPNVLAITAANTREMSDADVYDQTLGVFLSNAFARTFRDQVFNNNDVSIYELYHELVRTTIGSHVSLYNQDLYGSVYTNTLADFFPQ